MQGYASGGNRQFTSSPPAAASPRSKGDYATTMPSRKPEKITVRNLLGGSRRANFGHRCRRDGIRPELVRAACSSEEQESRTSASATRLSSASTNSSTRCPDWLARSASRSFNAPPRKSWDQNSRNRQSGSRLATLRPVGGTMDFKRVTILLPTASPPPRVAPRHLRCLEALWDDAPRVQCGKTPPKLLAP